MFILQVKSFVKEGLASEFIKVASLLVEKSRQEKGCVSYQLCQDQKNPNVFTFIQQWKDPDLLEKYVQTNYFKELAARCAPLEEKASEFTFYNVLI